MKKIILVLFLGYISVIGGLNCASAQETQNNLAFKKIKPEKQQQLQPGADTMEQKATANTSVVTVNKKALTDFRKSFADVSGESWSMTKEGGYLVRFSKEDINTRVFYGKKGRWISTIRDYTEEKLPKDVRHLVKSTYYDFSILFINEVAIEDQIVYVMTLEDKTCQKKIHVHNGEVFEKSTFLKNRN